MTGIQIISRNKLETVPFNRVADFMSNIDMSGKCWLWNGYRSPKGYGTFGILGRGILAHRLFYQIAFGPIPQTVLVCHKCDNPSCVRPSHLYAGDHQTNLSDMVDRGRSCKGDRHYLRKDPSKIIRGDAHYIRKHPEKIRNGERHHNARLRKEDVIRMREMYSSGSSTSDLSKEFGVGIQHVWQIVTRLRWKSV
jgi:hypothetical protein